MNRKQNDDRNEREHALFEDRALDSQIRELGRSENDGVEFADRVMARIGVASGQEDSKMFFGRPSLSASIKLSDAKSPGVEAVCNTKSSLKTTPTNKPTAISRTVVFAASLAAIVLLAGVWVMVGSGTSKIESADNSKSKIVPIKDSVETNSVPQIADTDDPFDANPLSTKLVLETKDVGEAFQPNEPKSASEVAGPLDVLGPRIEKPNPIVATTRKTPRWVLAFEFDEHGGGATINEKELTSRIPLANLDFVLNRIEYALIRRVCYLAPALDDRWAGSIRISSSDAGKTIHFDSLEKMQGAFGRARGFARQLLPEHSSVNLHHAETFVLEALDETDSILLETVASGLTRDELLFQGLGYHPNPPRFRHYRTITLQELLTGLDAGKIQFPTPSEQFDASTVVQDRGSEELRNELDTTVPSIDMFADIDQFRKAEAMIEGTTVRGGIRVKLRHINDQIAKFVKQRDQSNDPEQIQVIQAEIGKLARKTKTLRKELRSAVVEKGKERLPVEPLVQILPTRPDLQGLGLVMGDECHLDQTNARTMSNVSTSVGRAVARFDNFGSRDFSQHNEKRFEMIKYLIGVTANAANSEQGLSTLDQMLQMERPEIRLELVNVLRENGSPTALGLLACYAKYDLEPSVRIAAVDALRDFPPDEYRVSLLNGITYPWPEVAKHAAEALVRLNDTGAVPELVEMLDRPDPRTPEWTEGGRYYQRELVGINHMRNCTLCHADSQDKSDLGRGLIPIWDNELPRQYYKAVEGPMVRADITYLRQDFSVIQKVKNAAPWPEFQRFDYVVRAKSLTREEYKSEFEKYSQRPSEYHAAVAKALRMLTGENPGDDTYETWKAVAGN